MRVARGHAPLVAVLRREIPYWQERGWRRAKNRYAGSYQTRYGAFEGWIEEDAFGRAKFYVYNPPQAVRHDAHWACFTPRGSDWFMVHMGKRPNDVSSGIMTIERLITEAHER
ncbi:MAG: hypothetical protein LAO79_28190 [Acidobacteriia bacterium]|nr:hypothetical protein [Terriglobia bacterium]